MTYTETHDTAARVAAPGAPVAPLQPSANDLDFREFRHGKKELSKYHNGAIRSASIL